MFSESDMKKLIAALAAAALLVLTACGTQAEGGDTAQADAPEAPEVTPVQEDILPEPEEQPESEAQYGNTSGNISNSAFVVQYGETVYYVVPTPGWDVQMGELRKADGGDTVLYSGDRPTCLNVDGDWIYYIDGIYSGIYRMRADGMESAPLLDDEQIPGAVEVMALADGWIYFRCRVRDESGVTKYIYRVSTEGGEPDLLCQMGALTSCFAVYDGWIYYGVHENDAGETRRMRTDGTENTKIADVPLYCVSIADGRLYYIGTADSTAQIYSMNTDGTDNVLLADGAGAVRMNVFDGWIYFTDRTAVYKMRTDGTEKTKLCELQMGNSIDMNVTDGWVYLTSDGILMLRVRTDGSDLQMMIE